jgi:predicted sugar kinase
VGADYALTDAEYADAVVGTAREALESAGTGGDVLVTRPRNEGATVDD